MPETKPHPTTQEASDHGTNEAPSPLPSAKIPVTPVVAMAVVIVVMLLVLIVMKLKTPTADQKVADLRVELAELNRRSVSLGLPTLTGGEQLGDIASRLKKDADSMVLLSGRYQQLIDENNAELARKNAELLGSRQYQQGLTNDLVRLKNELQQAKSAGYEAESLRREKAELKTLCDAQVVELATLKQQLAAVGELASKEDMESLQRRYEETLRAKEFFESRTKELEGELGKARLFARSENELLPAAVKLFSTLRKLENQSEADIKKAYSQIGVDLGANVVNTLTFATGSAKMATADEGPVRQLVDNVPDGDLLLVIGYASETGNVDGNRTLSSDRATAVAELLTSVKRPGQQVQAVYLGQTDRFSSRFPERNQLCEVWQIHKQ
ncbi:MAG: OmpA family protein [Verrucomicrobia bacterium]|nr:OmpA family protein [Verrucomicrobiota bacterium]